VEGTVIVVIGTRPDAIKLIPVYHQLKAAGVHTLLCATNQHRELLDHVCNLFNVIPDITLNVMKENQHLSYVTTAVLQKSTDLFAALKPRCVIVQGDTTSSFAAALAAYYLAIPVVHIEAGLRTGDIYSPFPEEINRSFITKISSLHFAPTPLNVLNLLQEGVPRNRIFCVGNTIVDALMDIKNKIEHGQLPVNSTVKTFVEMCSNMRKKLVVLTTHRRESFQGGIKRILEAVGLCAQKYPDMFVFFPAHPNPHVQYEIAQARLDQYFNIHCSKPLDYHDLVYLLSAAHFIITDSGGIQEEAISLGKRVIILRDYTERVETLWGGMGSLVGTDKQAIIQNIEACYNTPKETPAQFIYGDGKTAQRIVTILLQTFSSTSVHSQPTSSILLHTATNSVRV